MLPRAFSFYRYPSSMKVREPQTLFSYSQICCSPFYSFFLFDSTGRNFHCSLLALSTTYVGTRFSIAYIFIPLYPHNPSFSRDVADFKLQCKSSTVASFFECVKYIRLYRNLVIAITLSSHPLN